MQIFNHCKIKIVLSRRICCILRIYWKWHRGAQQITEKGRPTFSSPLVRGESLIVNYAEVSYIVGSKTSEKFLSVLHVLY